MKAFKMFIGLVLALSCASSVAANIQQIPADSWCAYTEFPMAKNPSLKDQEGVIRVRALQCNGQPGGVTVPSLSDPSKNCPVDNSVISTNLVKIADKTCATDEKICLAAYQALKVYNPVNLKKNPAYLDIFGCE